MKIIIPNLPVPGFFDVIQCLETIKNTIDIEPLFWDVQAKSLMDMFDEAQPDIVFLHESQIDQSFHIISQELGFKYILFTSSTELIDSLARKPDLILSAFTPESNLTQHDNVLYVEPMVHVAQIHNAKYDPKLESEVLINTNNVIVDENLHSVLSLLINQYRTKIIGNQPVPFLNYLGDVTTVERASFIKSAQVVIDLTLQDVLDAAYLKTPAISHHPFNDAVFQFAKTAELKNQIDSLLNNGLVRTEYINRTHQLALEKTAYHFTSTVFNAITEPVIADHLMKYIRDLT